jgi:hypothetical protein
MTVIAARAPRSAAGARGQDFGRVEPMSITPEHLPRGSTKNHPRGDDRFRRAYEHAVAAGYFDTFNDEHYHHHRNRHHGADVQATSPMTAVFMDKESGYRLLPWHKRRPARAPRSPRARGG